MRRSGPMRTAIMSLATNPPGLTVDESIYPHPLTSREKLGRFVSARGLRTVAASIILLRSAVKIRPTTLRLNRNPPSLTKSAFVFSRNKGNDLQAGRPGNPTADKGVHQNNRPG